MLLAGVAVMHATDDVSALQMPVFVDDFESGLSNWDVEGGTADTDCTNGWAGGCSMLAFPAQSSPGLWIRHHTALPLGEAATVSVLFLNPDLTGNTDSAFTVLFAEGGGVKVTISGEINDKVQLRDNTEWITLYDMNSVAWRMLEMAIDPVLDKATVRVLTADGDTQLGSTGVIDIPAEAETISLLRVHGHAWGNDRNGRFLYDDLTVLTTALVPGPPAIAGLDEDFENNTARMNWSPPTENAANVTSYNVYRGVDGGVLQPIASTTGLSFADTAMPCAVTVSYAVGAVSPEGEGQLSPPATLTKHDTTDLLCRLNARHAMYWGPFDALDPSPPVAPAPGSIAALEAHLSENGQFPTWFLIPPASVSCCSVISYDPDLLDAGPSGGFSYPLQAQIAGLVPNQAIADQFGEAFTKIGSADLTYHGFRFEGIPFDDVASGSAAVLATNTVSLELEGPGFNGSAAGHASGKLLRSSGTGNLATTGLDTLFVTAQLPGPSLPGPKDGEFKLPLGFRAFGKNWGIEPTVSYELTLDTEIKGMLGGRVESGTFVPKMAAGGIGADIDAALGLGIDAVDLRVVRVTEIAAGATASASAKVEVFVPLGSGLSPGEPVISPYTNTFYRDIDSPVVAVFLGPASFDILPIEGSVEVRGPNIFGDWVTYWEGDVSIDVLGLQHWDGAVLVLGRTEVSSSTHDVLPLLGARAAASGGLGALSEIDEPVLPGTVILDVTGTPGSVDDVTVTQAVAHVLPNGSVAVSPWSFTIPEVAVDEDGKASLVVETAEVQQRIYALTSAGLDLDTAIIDVNGALDTNGDGIADLTVSSTEPDNRTLTAINLMHGPNRRAYVGEPFALSIDVENAWTAERAGPGGSVELLVDEIVVAELPWTGDVLEVAPVLPVLVSPGSHALTARYSGDDDRRVAQRVVELDVTERPPQVTFESPAPFATIGGDDGDLVTIRFTTDDATDIDAASAVVTAEGHPPVVATHLGDGVFEATLDYSFAAVPALDDGFIGTSVSVADLAGNVGTASIALSLDRKDPSLIVGETPNVIGNHTDYSVPWIASEPVGVRLILDPAEGPALSEPIVVHSDGFASEGVLVAEAVPRGVYTVTVEAVDAGGNHAVDGDIVIGDGVIVLPGRVLVVA